jgi:hypothetical protein
MMGTLIISGDKSNCFLKHIRREKSVQVLETSHTVLSEHFHLR